MTLSERELERYKRQMLLEGWGEETQAKLKSSAVFVAGAGGLGSPVTMYLAVAGVGRIRLCDFDSPEMSNLNRQILHEPSDIGKNKAVSGQETIARLNPDVEVTAITTRIESDNVDELVGDSRVIVDCMDNIPTRFVLNACAMRKRIPLVHGTVWGLEGRLAVFRPPDTACLQCLFPEAPPREIFPVVGATPGVIGCLQVVETLKILTGQGTTLDGKLLLWDGTNMQFRTFPIARDPDCALCGTR